MNLQDRIKNVKSFGRENFRIVEFDNDFSVAYEKQNIRGWETIELVDGTIEEQFVIRPETFVGYAVLPQKGIGSYNIQGINLEDNVNFSSSARKKIESYLKRQSLNDGSHELGLKQERFENDVNILYNKVFSQFNIKVVGDRNWETIGLGSLFCFGWPIIFPCALIYSILKRDEDSIKGAIFSFMGPFLLPEIVSELISPDYHKKRIKNRDIISKEKHEGSNIALDFYSDNPKNFRRVNFIFQNGLELDDWGRISEGKIKDFESAKYYVKSDENVEKAIHDIKEKRHEIKEEINEIYNKKKEFEEILAKLDQTGILEKIGF